MTPPKIVRIGLFTRRSSLLEQAMRAYSSDSETVSVYETPGALRVALSKGVLDVIVADDLLCARQLFQGSRAWEEPGSPRWVFVNVRSESRCAALLREGADEAIVADSPAVTIRLMLVARRMRANVTASPLRIGDLTLDVARRRVSCGRRSLRLTSHEWDVLRCLVDQYPRPVTMASLARQVWDEANPAKAGSRMQVYICYLRQKLSASTTVSIRNVRGIGYQLVARADRDERESA